MIRAAVLYTFLIKLGVFIEPIMLIKIESNFNKVLCR